MFRKYVLKFRKEFDVVPEKCDLCRSWFMHMNYLEPEVVAHGMDNLHLCDACMKQVLKDEKQLRVAERSEDIILNKE